jgi:phosphoribosylformylglycinamidine cyclo-ligase
VEAGAWREPAVFGFIRDFGGIPEDEMRRVFNMGVGFCAVVRLEDVEKGLAVLGEAGCEAAEMGTVVEDGVVEFV